MKDILIIGGSYFVGKVFVEELVKESDYSITVLNRGNRPLRMQGLKEIVCDRNDVDKFKQSVSSTQWDVIVDFCAYTPQDIENALSVFPKGGVKHYIYISTTSIYQATQMLPITEDAPKLSGPQPELGPQAADYAYNKWLGEIRLKELCSQKEINYTSFRPAIIYGKYNYAPRESYFFDSIIESETIIIPDNRLPLFSFVSVWDVAKILIASLGNEELYKKEYNLSSLEFISYARFAEVLEEIAGKFLYVNIMSIRDINSSRIPLPFPLNKHLIYSGALIQSILGFEYTPFIDGMRDTYNYYLQSRGISLS